MIQNYNINNPNIDKPTKPDEFTCEKKIAELYSIQATRQMYLYLTRAVSAQGRPYIDLLKPLEEASNDCSNAVELFSKL